jgi:hypothetical protein
MNEDIIKTVAERVLRRLRSEPLPSASERPQATPAAIDYFAPWTGEVYSAMPRTPAEHPSQEQFSVGEAAERAAVVRELVDFLEAEKCSIEKDKSCDHCGNCRTLGF